MASHKCVEPIFSRTVFGEDCDSALAVKGFLNTGYQLMACPAISYLRHMQGPFYQIFLLLRGEYRTRSTGGFDRCPPFDFVQYGSKRNFRPAETSASAASNASWLYFLYILGMLNFPAYVKRIIKNSNTI